MSDTADGLVVFEGPADLAVLNARLSALFLADASASERFWELLKAVNDFLWIRDVYEGQVWASSHGTRIAWKEKKT
jgi:hypothetical protein